MKTITTISTAVLLFTAVAVAGPDVIIREKAKQLRDQNNARQGVPPPAPPAQTGRPAAAPAGATTASASAAAQPPGLARLQANLAAIKTNAVVSAEQKQRLTQDLIATAQGATKPSAAVAGKLAADLAAACADKPLPASARSRIVQNLNAVLNPESIQTAQMEAVITDVQTVLEKNGVNRGLASAVAADLKVMAPAQKPLSK